ncbi:MAG: ACP S-malonyltransferase [Pseudomonadota bacterium]
MRAAVFPGQGSQSVGMGRALAEGSPAAKAVFEAVDDALGERLSALIWEGPSETLTLTENAQPALMAVSLAATAALEEAGAPPERYAAFVAGHSLGEYSALAAAGALSLGTAARLLRLRGQAMQAATPVGAGAMAAILGLELGAVEALAAEAAAAAGEGAVCEAANDNAPGQVVVSGSAAAVEQAIAIAKDKGAKRALPLSVSAPFHCALMQPAAEAMEAALAEAAIAAPKVPLIANVAAAPVSDPAEIRALLVRQVTGRVRWRESMIRAAEEGVSELVEIGAGKVLSGLAKRIDKRLVGRSIGAPEDVAAFVEALA